jgi:hypothetical protein
MFSLEVIIAMNKKENVKRIFAENTARSSVTSTAVRTVEKEWRQRHPHVKKIVFPPTPGAVDAADLAINV